MWCGLVCVCVCSLEGARCWVVRGGFAVVVVQEVGNGGGSWGFGVERDVCLGTSVVGGNAWDVFQSSVTSYNMRWLRRTADS